MVARGLKAAAFAAGMLALMAGCSEGENENRSVKATLYDVAEVVESGDGGTVFSVYRPDVAEGVTLTARGLVLGEEQEIGVGDCVFLAYVAENGVAYSDGEIDVKGCGRMLNAALMQGTPESLEGWDKDGVWLQSLWRAGDKVVVRAMLSYDAEPRVFALVVDEPTLRDEWPDAYLVHRRRSEGEMFKRQFYAAFDLGALWTYEGCKGLRIHVNNSNVPEAGLFVVEKPVRD